MRTTTRLESTKNPAVGDKRRRQEAFLGTPPTAAISPIYDARRPRSRPLGNNITIQEVKREQRELALEKMATIGKKEEEFI